MAARPTGYDKCAGILLLNTHVLHVSTRGEAALQVVCRQLLSRCHGCIALGREEPGPCCWYAAEEGS